MEKIQAQNIDKMARLTSASCMTHQLANSAKSSSSSFTTSTNNSDNNKSSIQPSTSSSNQRNSNTNTAPSLSAHTPRLRSKTSRARTAGINKQNLSSNHYVCSGCNKVILKDKFLLKACNKYWHENCLKCYRCKCRLGEIGSTLYDKSNLILCRQDYIE